MSRKLSSHLVDCSKTSGSSEVQSCCSNDIPGFQNRMGLFFFVLALFGFSCLTSLEAFAKERILFMRERSNGYYTPFTYFTAKVSSYQPCLTFLTANVSFCRFSSTSYRFGSSRHSYSARLSTTPSAWSLRSRNSGSSSSFSSCSICQQVASSSSSV